MAFSLIFYAVSSGFDILYPGHIIEVPLYGLHNTLLKVY
jgi:hypothetical protein